MHKLNILRICFSTALLAVVYVDVLREILNCDVVVRLLLLPLDFLCLVTNVLSALDHWLNPEHPLLTYGRYLWFLIELDVIIYRNLCAFAWCLLQSSLTVVNFFYHSHSGSPGYQAVDVLSWLSAHFVTTAFDVGPTGYLATSLASLAGFLNPLGWYSTILTSLADEIYMCPRPTIVLGYVHLPQRPICALLNVALDRPFEMSYAEKTLRLIAYHLFVTGLVTYGHWLNVCSSLAMMPGGPGLALRLLGGSGLYGKAHPSTMDSSTARTAFTSLLMPEAKPSKHHTHPKEAANRSQGTEFMKQFAVRTGLNRWSVQASRREIADGSSSVRAPYWTKDLIYDPSNDPIPSDPLVAMYDVDHYIDMPSWLALVPQPTLISTFQPEKAGDQLAEYSFSFKQDVVDYRVHGGGHYKHPVWTYQQDTVSAVHWAFKALPLFRTDYAVHRRKLSEHHELVLLWPLRTWNWWNTWISLVFVSGEPLRRFQLAAGKYNRLEVETEQGRIMSTAQEGECISVTVPVDIDLGLRNTALCQSTKIAYPTVQMRLSQAKVEADPARATIYCMYLNDMVPGGDYKAVSHSLIAYQKIFDNFCDVNAKISMKAFMNPLAALAWAPYRSKESDQHMVDERVKKVAVKEKKLTIRMSQQFDSFLQQFIPEELKHTFCPSELDLVKERLSTPTQRSILERTLFWCSQQTDVLRAFMKAEWYAEAKPPRAIVPFEGDTKTKYSMFTYPVSEHMKTQAWYAFSKTPLQIAQGLSEMAQRSRCAVSSDGSKWDGHYSNLLRELELRLLCRMYHPRYHAEISRLHALQYQRPVVTTEGVHYELGFARGSGSPETSCFNSVSNKFIAYLAFTNAGCSPHQAYLQDGMYGGDDGLTFDTTVADLVAAAKSVGQVYESEMHEYGTPIKLLSRYYSGDVWTGRQDSVCDIYRALRGFNLTAKLPDDITPKQKLYEKACAYFRTDGNTPVIGDYVRAVLEVTLYDPTVVGAKNAMVKSLPWFSQYASDVQYPNEVTLDDFVWCPIPPTFDAAGFCAHIRSIRESELTEDQQLLALMEMPNFDTTPQKEPKEPTATQEEIFPGQPVPVRPAFVNPCSICIAKGKNNVKHTDASCWSRLPKEERKRLRKGKTEIPGQ